MGSQIRRIGSPILDRLRTTALLHRYYQVLVSVDRGTAHGPEGLVGVSVELPGAGPAFFIRQFVVGRRTRLHHATWRPPSFLVRRYTSGQRDDSATPSSAATCPAFFRVGQVAMSTYQSIDIASCQRQISRDGATAAGGLDVATSAVGCPR